MNNGFDRAAWDRLATLFDGVPCDGCKAPNMAGICVCAACHGTNRRAYSGHKPAVHEAPNGDTKACPAAGCDGGERKVSTGRYEDCPTCVGTGRVPNVDAGPAGKRYLHVAEKYLAQHPGLEWPRAYLARAYYEICRVADALHVPDAYYPRPEDTTLRVLEYPSAGHARTFGDHGYCVDCGESNAGAVGRDGVCPKRAPGAGTAEHTDADLFTIVCWRETPEDLECLHPPCDNWPGGPSSARDKARASSPGLHIGQIGELVGLGPATPHRVPARPYVQRSVVAFALPKLAAMLPDGRSVGGFLDEWKKRARYT